MIKRVSEILTRDRFKELLPREKEGVDILEAYVNSLFKDQERKNRLKKEVDIIYHQPDADLSGTLFS